MYVLIQDIYHLLLFKQLKAFTVVRLLVCTVLFFGIRCGVVMQSPPPQRRAVIRKVYSRRTVVLSLLRILLGIFWFTRFSFSFPSIWLHRLWLQRPFGNGIGRDSVRPNRGFIPVQSQLVSRAFETQLLWKCMDASRGLQQSVDTGSMLVLLLRSTAATCNSREKTICTCNVIEEMQFPTVPLPLPAYRETQSIM